MSSCNSCCGQLPEPSLFPSQSTPQKQLLCAALEAGAVLLIAVAALRGDPAMVDVVARTGAEIVMMIYAWYASYDGRPHYDDVVGEISSF